MVDIIGGEIHFEIDADCLTACWVKPTVSIEEERRCWW
jgi:(2Fe-2S) ferredoxin